MSRQDEARLGDIVEAIDAIPAHLTRGDLHDGLVYDPGRVRLIEIGEAVKGTRPDLLSDVPGVPWGEIARMRDHLARPCPREWGELVSVRKSQECSEARPAPNPPRVTSDGPDPSGFYGGLGRSANRASVFDPLAFVDPHGRLGEMQ